MPTLNIGFALNDKTLVSIIHRNVKTSLNSFDDRYYNLQGKVQENPKEGHIYLHQGQKVIFYHH